MRGWIHVRGIDDANSDALLASEDFPASHETSRTVRCTASFHTPPPATGGAVITSTTRGNHGGNQQPPATSEAGTSEVEKARQAFYEAARKRAATWLALRKPKSGDPGAYEAALKTYDEDVARSDAAYDAMLAAEARALPEAREGGG